MGERSETHHFFRCPSVGARYAHPSYEAVVALSVRPETFFTFSRRYCGRLVRCTRFSMSPHRLRGRACQPTYINAMKKQTKFPDGH
jgi:hypothetical protein